MKQTSPLSASFPSSILITICIRPKKRYSPFLRAEKLNDLDVVKEYYGYNNEKAKSALDILTKDEVKLIKEKLFKGGKK